MRTSLSVSLVAGAFLFFGPCLADGEKTGRTVRVKEPTGTPISVVTVQNETDLAVVVTNYDLPVIFQRHLSDPVFYLSTGSDSTWNWLQFQGQYWTDSGGNHHCCHFDCGPVDKNLKTDLDQGKCVAGTGGCQKCGLVCDTLCPNWPSGSAIEITSSDFM